LSDAGTVRVLLADEQSLFREAVRVVLAGVEGLEVVGEASDGVQAVAEAVRLRPDVALIDGQLPNGDGTSATRRIVGLVPGCKVIVLSGEQEQHILPQVVEAGATAFVTKASPIQDLILAVRAVHRGEAVIPPRLLPGLLSALVGRRQERDVALRGLLDLTRREREVLGLLALGAGNDLISQRLVISPATARTHVQNTLNKLGVHSRLEAAAFVMKNGLLDDLACSDVDDVPERRAHSPL
jgi:DNA-binding NarL/FixJ family response regulator